MGTKIATCCYCGTRAALVLDRGRHELACRACGAPLHEMKAMPVPKEKRHGGPGHNPRVTGKGRPKRRRDHGESRKGACARDDYTRREPRRGRRRKPFLRKVAEEVWDLLEDIID